MAKLRIGAEVAPTADETVSPTSRWARRTGLALAASRVALGVSALVCPGPLGRAWVGPAAGDAATSVLGRALGARDLALGLGALSSANDAERRRWFALGALSDVGDTLATVGTFALLPRQTRWLVLATCAGAAVVGAAAAGLQRP